MLHAMIMAGGGGTRFWPRSRVRRPKQFLSFGGDRSLLQATVDRVEAPIGADRIWVITSALHRDQAIEQLPNVPPAQIIGEPMGRDTAACIGLGAALIARRDPDAAIAVMPADHLIEPAQEFRRAIVAAERVLEENPDALLTLGIPPTFPSTGFGYIRRGESLPVRQGVQVFKVQGFREKPNHETAEQFLASGEYYWNSGIFIWRAQTILRELAASKPGIHAAVSAIAEADGTDMFGEVFRREYSSCEKISIDFAVMEKAREVIVLRAPFQWDDVGSWPALERRHPQDAEGNTVQARHLGIRTSGCIVVGDPDRLVTTIGVSNLLIIQDGDALLIADRRDESAVKEIVERMKKSPGLEQFL